MQTHGSMAKESKPEKSKLKEFKFAEDKSFVPPIANEPTKSNCKNKMK